MPTVLTIDGFKFRFFSNEENEPPHVHVQKAENECKYWLNPILLNKNYGFKGKELKKIERIISENLNFLQEEYNERLRR